MEAARFQARRLGRLQLSLLHPPFHTCCACFNFCMFKRLQMISFPKTDSQQELPCSRAVSGSRIMLSQTAMSSAPADPYGSHLVALNTAGNLGRHEFNS